MQRCVKRLCCPAHLACSTGLWRARHVRSLADSVEGSVRRLCTSCTALKVVVDGCAIARERGSGGRLRVHSGVCTAGRVILAFVGPLGLQPAEARGQLSPAA